jgi:hypothetical protein
MKKILFLIILLVLAVSTIAQPLFDLGIKAGINYSQLTPNVKDFSAENIIGYHAGAFTRVGMGRIYLQPEVYFSSKGGNLKEIKNADPVAMFGYSSVDVPLLLGAKVFKVSKLNFRAMGGPVFGFITSRNVDGDSRFSVDNFRDRCFGWQYGLGVDIWMFTLDARIENSRSNVYQSSLVNSKNKTLLISLGFKIL